VIPYGRQHITEEDIQSVVAVLRSDFLTQGPRVPEFEAALRRETGARHALAVNSATSALHIACLALGVGPGDVVWTSPITFLASANCALYCGASVDFVDIDPATYNLSVDALRRKLEQARAEDRLPKVVIPVHLAGQPCDMAGIHALALEYGFHVVEDASHAIGGRYRGEPIGNGRYSDITVFSFHPVKIITTAEGGAAMTNSDELAARMALFRSHGMTRDPALMTHPPDGDWYYQQVALGYNYRMTELQAALGLSQIGRLHANVARRHQLHARYDSLLAGLPLQLPWQHPDGYSGLHLYIVRLKLDRIARSHRQVFDALRAAGIGVNLHYIPVYSQPIHAASGFRAGDFPESERYYAEAISLPMYASLSDEEQSQVVDALAQSLLA
jgi:UDP-4-amino-4,6-dideoxy-N-acetyl-beta-L-altrosamine transaminase